MQRRYIPPNKNSNKQNAAKQKNKKDNTNKDKTFHDKSDNNKANHKTHMANKQKIIAHIRENQQRQNRPP